MTILIVSFKTTMYAQSSLFQTQSIMSMSSPDRACSQCAKTEHLCDTVKCDDTLCLGCMRGHARKCKLCRKGHYLCALDGCKRKLLLTDGACRCKSRFCSKHQHAHGCTFDYHAEFCAAKAREDAREFSSVSHDHGGDGGVC